MSHRVCPQSRKSLTLPSGSDGLLSHREQSNSVDYDKRIGFGFLCIASPQKVDPRLSVPPSGQGASRGLEPTTEESLQISGRGRYPLCHKNPHRV
ncbi:hypothetical protein PoB_006614800 [Plakobranchus ocellatus]|uniref:Uncharacterized protein n=1 Tax=Plakobranchus ocellatus TaxID=259542 RepID=A0AAV4D618_9GAST|nr:hypothetical protein PoB_006614800 [Plakobranchus ocellatus]